MILSFMTRSSTKYERRLLALCLNNPDKDQDIEEWNKNAVRYLVRELKKDIKLLDELERAITQKVAHTKCIHVTKTPDRRLLVSHRRGLPQVIFCRLWRWPDLQSHHQIRAISTCESGVQITSGVNQPSSLKTVCINPFHYERYQPNPIEPILITIPRIPPDLTSSCEDSAPITGTKSRPGNLSLYHSQIEELSMMNQEYQSSQPPPQSARRHPQQLPADQQFQPSSPQYQQVEHVNPSRPLEQPLQQQSQHSPQQQQSRSQQPQTQQQQQDQQQAPQSQQPEQQYLQQTESALQQYQTTQSECQQTESCDQQDYLDGYTLNPPLVYHSPYSFQQDIPPQAVTPMLVSELTLDGEIARPFRFKQNRFAQMARARHEYSIVSRYPPYDPHGYISNPYRCSNQPILHSQVTYQSRSVSHNQPGSPAITQQQTTTVSYATTTATSQASNQYASQQQSVTPTYTTMYTPQQQTQYTQQEQMQLDYQPDSAMTVANPAADRTYYSSVACTSQHQMDQQMDQTPMIDIQEIPYTEGECWCSISYHEYDQRIGEKYHSNCRVVSVDGYTQPMCSDRFCIGGISNVNRNHFTEWVRRRIGRGVRFTYIDGEVHVDGLSEASIFVSNPLQGQGESDPPVEHVYKLTQGCSAKVFSTQQFSKLLAEAVTKGFESVYKLTSCCVIRVSFVKGWGRNYKRHSILNTPCWVEVQLNGPLQWIDKALRQMRAPTGCGSTS